MVSDTIRLIGSVLPGLATRWIDAYARDPAWFLVWVFLVAFLTWISSRLAGSISDHMRLLSTQSLPASNKPAAPRAPRVASPLQSILFVGIIVYLLFYPTFREIPGVWLAGPARTGQRDIAGLYGPAGTQRPRSIPHILFPAGLHGERTQAVTHLSVDPAHIQIRRCAGSISDRHPLSRSRFRQSLPLLDPRRVRRLLHRDGGTEPPKRRLQECGGKRQAELTFDASPAAANQPNNLCVSTGRSLRPASGIVLSSSGSLKKRPNHRRENGRSSTRTPIWAASRFLVFLRSNPLL